MTVRSQRRPATSRGRKWIHVLLAIALTYAVIEALSWITYRVVFGHVISMSQLDARRDAVTADPGASVSARDPEELPLNAREALHPYLGYVFDPDRAGNQPVNEHGFLGAFPPAGETGDTGSVTVLVTGGSVAMGLVHDAAPALAEEIGRAGALGGKPVTIYNLALPGMKQPQQLMMLVYLFSLGVRPDIVINLDGFNDIVLPVAENASQGLYPFYPRSWNLRLGSGLSDSALLRKAGRLAYREQFRGWLASAFSTPLLARSVTGNLIWVLADAQLARSIRRARYSLARDTLDPIKTRGDQRRFATHGTLRTYAGADEHYRDVAAFWARASLIMRRLADGMGSRYFHFLQPNQYVMGSKHMTSEERQVAVDPGHPYAGVAATGYPFLIEAGGELAARGVPFEDLTMLFSGDRRVLYSDQCCHLNEEGYRTVAVRIGAVVRAALDRGG